MNSKFIILLLTAAAFSVTLAGQDPARRMKEADDLYQKGDYFNAATIYKDLYDQGYRSGNLMYNAGNAWFKAKNYGYAVLFYERAGLYNPASEDVNYNLQMAKSRVTDKFEEVPELFFVRWFDFISLLNSTNQWATMAITLFIITLVLGLLFLFSPLKRLRYPSFWIAVVTLSLSVVTLVFSLRSNKLVNHNNNAVVICEEVVGKSSPGGDGKDLFVIHSGTKVLITRKNGVYTEVRLPDGNKGWTRGDCLERL